MKKIILLLVLIFVVFYSFSQLNTFSKRYTQAFVIGNSIVKTLDNGFIIVGEYPGGSILKIDSNGNNTWIRMYEIPLWFSISLKDIEPTFDSCFIITGCTPNPSSGSSDIVCMKIDTYGNTLWCKAISGSGAQDGVSIKETFDHGFIIAGVQNNISKPYISIVAVKLDSIGNLEWRRVMTFGNSYNSCVSVKQLPDGGYIFLASVIDDISIINGAIVLFKLSSSGASIWSKKYLPSTTASVLTN